MHPRIHAAILSDDPVTSAVLSRALKEWWCAAVTCEVFPSYEAVTGTAALEQVDVVFVTELADEDEFHAMVKAIGSQARPPVCFVVTGAKGDAAHAIAQRAGARGSISRYVIEDDELHRCLWSVLRERGETECHGLAAKPVRTNV